MYIALDLFCLHIPLTMLFAAVLFFFTCVGGWGWPISVRDILIYFDFYQFSNNLPNSAFVDDAMTFIIMLHSTCTGPFSWEIACIGVLDFCPRKIIFTCSASCLWF